jgi:hypothetical protein
LFEKLNNSKEKQAIINQVKKPRQLEPIRKNTLKNVEKTIDKSGMDGSILIIKDNIQDIND